MQFLAGAAAYIDARSLASVVLLVAVVYRTLPTRTRRRARDRVRVRDHVRVRARGRAGPNPLAPVCTPRTRTLDWGQGRAIGPFCVCAVSHCRV
jgi:hypothetical protein